MQKKRTVSHPSVSSKAVSQLRDEVHGYHVEVVEALATMQTNCKHCHAQVEGLDLQINGEKPERDDAPSMKHDIGSLKQSRNSLRRGIQVLWIVLTGIGGIAATLFTVKWNK